MFIITIVRHCILSSPVLTTVFLLLQVQYPFLPLSPVLFNYCSAMFDHSEPFSLQHTLITCHLYWPLCSRTYNLSPRSCNSQIRARIHSRRVALWISTCLVAQQKLRYQWLPMASSHVNDVIRTFSTSIIELLIIHTSTYIPNGVDCILHPCTPNHKFIILALVIDESMLSQWLILSLIDD